jgi:hypothetical protein
MSWGAHGRGCVRHPLGRTNRLRRRGPALAETRVSRLSAASTTKRGIINRARGRVPEPLRVSRSQFAVALRQQVSPTITLLLFQSRGFMDHASA